ncbi:MAG: DEAD/DEAH box helicase [Myxococcota bacterium]|nr:DEAD/DEAH box helicase [Myxococcota bacterium]
MSDENTSPVGDFAGLGLGAHLVQAVTELGYEAPTSIQAKAIPVLLEGQDVLGLAATGTGKTAAFTLPLLERISQLPARKAPRALIIVPTRELALQVARAVHTYGRSQGLRVLPIYGGAAYRPQLQGLTRGVDVVVATPGRAIDHLNRGSLRLDEVRCVVLDEADEMLDMGFQEDIEALFAATPEGRQTALFSATFPQRLQRVARNVLRDPVKIAVERTATAGDQPAVKQVACIVRRNDKPAALVRILDIEAPEAAIVFCRTREVVDDLAELLGARGLRVEALHGGFSQQQRERVMRRLRAGANDLLIATDVAARGIDIAHLTHVINFDLPQAPEQYVHRIGRTGRAGRSGMAISLVTRRERRLMGQICQHTGVDVQLRPVPRVEDLRRRQIKRLVDEVEATLSESELATWVAAAEGLLETHEANDVVAALLRMAHEQVAPDLDEPPDERSLDAGGNGFRNDPRKQRDPRRHAGNWAPLWVDIGGMSRVRPGDLVGAFAGEAGIAGNDVGAIHITERFSVVEVRQELVQMVIERMQGATIRGRRVQVRPYQPRR